MDGLEKTTEVAADLGFPVFHGVNREQGDAMGSWWEERRNHIQPTEFILTQKGRVLGSTYSSSPVGRMDPDETLSLLRIIKQMQAKKT